MYPSFAATSLMTWLAIVHAARGILYRGTDAAWPAPAVRAWPYAMARELAAPLSDGQEAADASLEVNDSEDLHKPGRGVRLLVRRAA
ncbi:MAG: hypothetical protein NZ554_07740 [Bryobacteraceae bacterium]|nr:hypothetical protein [Bryobacteraceae bacterium]